MPSPGGSKSRMMLGVEPSVVASLHGQYRSLFDRRSGLLARYLDEPVTPAPEIIEVNLVGPDGQLFELDALRRLLREAQLCCQVLLTGKPEAHPAFSSVLRMIRDHGAVPSVVIEGATPSSNILDALKRFAGFVSVDCGFDRDRIELARDLRNIGLKVQLHIPVADATTEWLTDTLSRGGVHHLSQMITLTGRSCTGVEAKVTGLSIDENVEKLLEFTRKHHSFRLGLDGRLSSLFLGRKIGHRLTMPQCEAGRCGLFVNHDQTVAPCSLLADRIVGSIAEQSLSRIWSGPAMQAFRREVRGAPDQAPVPPCGRIEGNSAAALNRQSTGHGEAELRFGYASSSLCDRALPPLAKSQAVQVLAAVRDWRALRFFTDDASSTQVAASWTSLEYFLSLPPIWGQDLARLHEQLVAGTFEGKELREEYAR